MTDNSPKSTALISIVLLIGCQWKLANKATKGGWAPYKHKRSHNISTKLKLRYLYLSAWVKFWEFTEFENWSIKHNLLPSTFT